MDCGILLGNLDKAIPQKRIEFIKQFFDLPVCVIEDETQLIEDLDRYQKVKVVVLSLTHLAADHQLVGPVQAARMASPSAFILVVINRKVSADAVSALAKSGSSLVISSVEFQQTSILEFIITSYIRGQWLTYKSEDLLPDTIIPFSLYHLLPINQKFLPIIVAGDRLNSVKVERLRKIAELYYHRRDVKEVTQYVSQLSLEGAASLNRRCRLYFQNAWIGYQDFIIFAFDYGHGSNLEIGSKRWESLKTLSETFVMSLASVTNLDFILDRSVKTMTHPIQVSLLSSSLASYLSLMAGVGDPVRVFLAGLLGDMGLVEVPYTGLQGLIQKQIQVSDPIALDVYQKRNRLSLQRLGRLSIPVDPAIRDLVSFQNVKFSELSALKISPERLPLESQLLLLGDGIARFYLIQEGFSRLSVQQSIQMALNQALQERWLKPDLIEILNARLKDVA